MAKDFLTIDGVLLDADIGGVTFFCDVAQCKGACCTMESELSAPLAESEIGKIEKALPIVKEYLPPDHILAIEERGFWEAKGGAYRTWCLNRRDCVFVYYEGDIARCSIERAYREGRIGFMKPLSCHLFPIKISGDRWPVLSFEQYPECKPAMIKGREENVLLIDFCQDALQRVFGEEWLEKMRKALANCTIGIKP
jgi:Fe-S-cluster containining protein